MTATAPRATTVATLGHDFNTTGSRGVINAPFGGYKHSGFGRKMSADSILDYTQEKSVIINTADPGS